MSVLDFSARAPRTYPADVEGVMRYIAPRRADGSRRPKCVTPDELAAHAAARRSVGFVFEADAGSSLGGAAQGDYDGAIAVREMQTLGVPAGVAVYAAVDRDITTAQLPVVAGYLDAFHRHTTTEGYRRGIYGEYDVVVTMLRDGHADLAWQTVAWSQKRSARGVHGVVLFQNGHQVVVDGAPCDVNDVWAPDWGQWTFAPSQPTSTPAHRPLPKPIVTTYPEENVKSIDLAIDTDDHGRGYADIDEPAAHVVSVMCNTANPTDKPGYRPIPDVARIAHGAGTRVVVEEAVPNGRIDVTVWILEAA